MLTVLVLEDSSRELNWRFVNKEFGVLLRWPICFVGYTFLMEMFSFPSIVFVVINVIAMLCISAYVILDV